MPEEDRQAGGASSCEGSKAFAQARRPHQEEAWWKKVRMLKGETYLSISLLLFTLLVVTN